MKINKNCKPCPPAKDPIIKVGDIVFTNIMNVYGIVTDVDYDGMFSATIKYTTLTYNGQRLPGEYGSCEPKNCRIVNAELCIMED